MADAKEIIAARAAKELKDGDVVNLGIGLPTLVADFLPAGIEVIIHSENGIMGMAGSPEPGKADPHIVNAGGQPAGIKKGAVFLDSAASFGIIRGGHVDVTILGALEVDQEGNLANWIVPGKMIAGMGGAMDLAAGAKRVIVAMTHTQKGAPKILKRCRLPFTALGVVNLIITEMAVIEVSPGGLIVKELLDGHSFEEVKAATEADIIMGWS
jgi:acetate CoA/acetoacetate CoA-transferase beta subunit